MNNKKQIPTKTLKFDNDVLNIVSAIEWQDNGRLGVLACGQLDRQLYLRVNKVLEALGGKWNRKRGGHVFPMDPRPQVEGLVESGTLIIERDGFFETPPEIVKRMVELVNPIGKILELPPAWAQLLTACRFHKIKFSALKKTNGVPKH